MHTTGMLSASVVALLGLSTTVFCARMSSNIVQLLEAGKTSARAQKQVQQHQQQQQQVQNLNSLTTSPEPIEKAEGDMIPKQFAVGDRVKSTEAIDYQITATPEGTFGTDLEPLNVTIPEGSTGTVVALAPELGVSWDAHDSLFNAAVFPEQIEMAEEQIATVMEQFTLGDHVKSTVAIDYGTETVPEGAVGIVVALPPQLSVDWESFDSLTNAVVFPGQIEKTAEKTEEAQEQFAVGNRVKSTGFIQYGIETVPEGTSGTVIALAPQLGVRWDDFEGLQNAVVIPRQIEKVH